MSISGGVYKEENGKKIRDESVPQTGLKPKQAEKPAKKESQTEQAETDNGR